MSDLLTRLSDHTSSLGSKTALSFLDDKLDISSSLSYASVDAKSRGVAAFLYQNGLKAGDRVVLVYPPSLDYIVSFLGCLMAGVIAVPVFPPDPADLSKHVDMFCVIVKSCGAQAALTSASYNYATKLAGIRSFVNSASDTVTWPELSWFVTDGVAPDSDFKYTVPHADKIAFLQYTSGSTSEPKGVMISHGNLTHNLQCIIKGLNADQSTVVVSWLPQYHDMGLIGSYLGILFCGGSGYYLSPVSFVRRPSLWILAMSKYSATHMQAPNFAYGLTARKFKEDSSMKVDLSSVRHMINAAEPVDMGGMKAFYGKFAGYGLKRGVIFPTYGLAEHTVYVCSNGKQVLTVDKASLETEREVVLVEVSDNDSNVTTLVGCGVPNELPDLQLRIVDPDSYEALGEDRVGEIWILSGSKAQGYWGLQEKSEETFQAKMKGQNPESEGFLKSGDLGFLHNQELFICGRNKDLIIVRGRNHYPQDIEHTVEVVKTHEGRTAFRKGCSAAFSMLYSDVEILVCAAELTVEVADSALQGNGRVVHGLLDAVKSEVSALHGITPNVVLLLQPRTIPKTTSGKIARQWVKTGYLKGTLTVVEECSNLSSLKSNDDESSRRLPTEKSVAEVTASHAHPDSKKAVDPTEVSLETTLSILVEVVADVLQTDVKTIDSTVPLNNLGVDSLLGVQLVADLEQRFTVPIPEKLFTDPDTSLSTVAMSLLNRGIIKPRAELLNGWDITAHDGFVRSVTKGEFDGDPVSNQWHREKATMANIDDGSFPHDTVFQGAAPPLPSHVTWKLNIATVGLVAVPILTIMVAVAIYLAGSIEAAGVFASIVMLAWSTYIISDKRKFFRANLSVEVVQALCHYLGFRLVAAGALDLNEGFLFVSESSSSDINLLFVCTMLHQLLHGFVFGAPLCQGVHISFLKTPLLSPLLATLRCVPETQLDADVTKGAVMSSRRRPDITTPSHVYIRAALERGLQLVPVYHYCRESPDGGTMFFGRIKRHQVLSYTGAPLHCPRVNNPSNEIVFEWSEKFRGAMAALRVATEELCDGNAQEGSMFCEVKTPRAVLKARS